MRHPAAAPDGGAMPAGDNDPSVLFERIPLGWSVMDFDGRRYGVTRTAQANGRIQKIFAEELGGSDVVSANLYLGNRFRPCEMPAVKVLCFLAGATVVPSPAARDRPF